MIQTGNDDARISIIDEIFKLKEMQGLSIDDIANELGYTNLYMTQVLSLKSPLNPAKAEQLGKLLNLPKPALDEMVKAPLRRFDESTLQEPTVYRLMEAVQHYGESIKYLINEKCGDGIPSAIDMYCDLDVSVETTRSRLILFFWVALLGFCTFLALFW